jgi:glycosyltransferase involved in cell wall biosynthesis
VRVAIVTNVTAPYRTELFTHVHTHVPDLHVYFQSDLEPLRTWERRPSLPFHHTYLSENGIRLGKRRIGLYHGFGRLLRQHAPDLLVGYGFSVATFRMARFSQDSEIPLVIACDATPETDPRSGLEYQYRKWLTSRASAFIAASSAAADYFQELGAARDRIEVVELTTDLEAIRAAQPSDAAVNSIRARLPGDGPVLVVAARLVPEKRIFDACRAFLSAAATIPDLRLAIAGDGPLKPTLQRWIAEHGSSRIHLLGLLTWEEMLALYLESDLLLFPATREKFGMVVIEALAAGVPVIAYRKSGAARDLIRDGENGFLIDEGDVDDMAAKIVQTLSNIPMWAEMGARAAGVIDLHDVRIEAKKFVRTLERTIGTSGSMPESTILPPATLHGADSGRGPLHPRGTAGSA